MCSFVCSPALFAGEPGEGEIKGGASYDTVAGHELAFVAEQLQRAGHNGSAWNYLRGLLTLPGGGDAWVHDERLLQLCCQVDVYGVLSTCRHVGAANRQQLHVCTERRHTVTLHFYPCCARTCFSDAGTLCICQSQSACN